MKVKWFSTVVLVIVFLFFAGANAQTNKVVIGYANFSPTYASVWVAKEMGFFEKHNLNADIIFIRGGAMGTQALVSRSFDFIVRAEWPPLKEHCQARRLSSLQYRPTEWIKC
jgi:ABC-type nitrate/sulfonate/bicarbonate transport system substrate-binding protein